MPGLRGVVETPAPPRAGRRRRFAPDVEVELLFDACFTVMERNAFNEVSVAEILAEAGVSTRSFYRHFASKDELICALYRRDADRAFAAFTARIKAAPTPVAALEAWVDEILSHGYDAQRSRRADVLRAPAVLRAEGSQREVQRTMEVLEGYLAAILRRGRRDGSFPATRPALDARAIAGAAYYAAGLVPAADRSRGLAAARRTVLSFSLRAVGHPAG